VRIHRIGDQQAMLFQHPDNAPTQGVEQPGVWDTP
jgi:hypothetical protein